MTDNPDLITALHGIADRIGDGMSEKDVENAFLNENFYTILGYDGAGYDLRSEWTLPDNKRPDYVTLDDNESVTAVYEFKTSREDLGGHTDQLFHYVDELKADYGVLTNGAEMRLFKRDGHTRILTVSLEEATESQAANLETALRKPDWDITNAESVSEYLETLDVVSLEGELGREHFFDTFRLEEDSPFANLVTAMMDMLEELRDEQEAKFVKGAYDFWEASYANVPDETPDSWEPFIDGKQSLQDFMFCLESGHALLARLLLAKATQDHDFFRENRGLDRYFNELGGGFTGTIDLDAYPVAANGMIEQMRLDLVESLFEDDIFIWWTDGYAEQTASQHQSPFTRFRDVAKKGSEVTRVSSTTRERFSRAVARVGFAVIKFDFSRIEGDPLGDLYQQYFDPETRKALGEFYTPQPVIDYIMDGVEYNRGVSNQRLIDPSCGSGTFLVEALNRYIADVKRYEDDPDWAEELTELCSRPRIVGLDIHPFAVLMAQIRFMVTILPEYKQAKQQNESFTLHRLPIFRTDTLRNERELTGLDLGDEGQTQMTLDAVTEDNQDVKIPVPLPVEVDEGEVPETDRDGQFLVQRVRMPLFETVKLNSDVRNFGEYFAALQGVLDVVKFHMSESEWEYVGGLEQGIHRYTTREYGGIEEFFVPYVDDILSTVRYLREEHGDGRLFKMFEDTVLALVVKNYMKYDYVVGNPPYVRIQHLPDGQKAMLDQLYKSTTGNYDIYCPFYERGLDWLVEETGKLGYITPNQFMVTDYGEGLRNVLLESRLKEVYDFRDSGVFEDATNYPAIVIAEDEPDEASRKDNQIRCVRVKANTDDESNPGVDEEIINSVREHRGNPGYSNGHIDVFDFPQKDLDGGYWSLMPPTELKLIQKLNNKNSQTLADVTDSVFAGTQTSANDVFLVNPTKADRIDPEDKGSTVTVIPKGEDREYEIETDTLRPWLQGRDVDRWRGKWSGQHVIVPYSIDRDEDGALIVELLSEEYMKEELPLTWEYICSNRETLESREGGRFEGKGDWYGFGYPKSMDRFEDPKLIGAEIASEATFMLDDVGSWYFKSAYGIQLQPEHQDKTELFAGLLNSKVLDFYLKHYTSLKMGGYYKYTTNYLSPLPILWDGKNSTSTIRDAISEITCTLDLNSKTNRFPEAYLGDHDGQLDYIEYEWQTRRYPVNAKIQTELDEEFTVQAGRSDKISHPAMYSSDREAQKLRAEYVHAAVDGRNVKSGEETTIPIPRKDRAVSALLDELESDRKTIKETSIPELEATIDEAVYDLFDLTDKEITVIENYLEVF